MDKKINRLTPVILGSTVMTAISVLPLINFINLFFCAGIMIGGYFGVIAYFRQTAGTDHVMTYRDGVLTGILSGILSAVVVSGINIIVLMYSKSNPVTESLGMLGELGKNLPPEVNTQMNKLAEEFNKYGYSPTLAIFTFVSNIVIYPLFGAIGALIGMAVIEKRKKKIINGNPE
ncbi:MAG: DUF4199 family protein [Ignavibacteria bacterium]|nr:DUF4199 family protein [Ignavibacteria bacterium]